MRISMRKARLRKFFAAFAACFSFWYAARLSGEAAFAADESAWTWEVLVVPPDEGWENSAGESIRNALLWHRAEISESGDGIHGHDLDFVFLPPTDEDSVEGYVLPITPQSVAILSFASYPVDRELTKLASGKRIPLMLGGGENVFFFDRGRLLPFVFALDLFRDYRARAFVDYAVKKAELQARLSVIGTRFTLHEEREAKICFDLFSEAGFMPMPFWADASVTDTFAMVEQEIKDYSDGLLVSYVGGMASKEIWRGIMGNQSPYRLWYGGAPDRTFLSFKGMLFADQNAALDARGGFEQLKRDLWTSRTLNVADKIAAGRANALAVWLTRALKALPPGDIQKIDKDVLVSRLENVREIPFGRQMLEIDEKNHRPRRRQVYILEVRDRNFFVLDVLDVEGLKYYDY
ncbi:MAG: hypothetical protein LBJ22_04525 [Synergistaceae bacterium]|jgi:hypothetical protein|nr:hypothetical protein [Synergistaceae bacterium]